MARDLDTMNFSSAALSPGAVDGKDDRQPLTESYSFTIAQRMPWSSLLEVAYVGNQSTDLAYSGGSRQQSQPGPVGAMLSRPTAAWIPTRLVANNFRPLKGFSAVNLATHGTYANYNSLQATWVRTKGRYTINLNYTFGKAMGILSSTYDSFNMRQQLRRAGRQPHAHLQRWPTRSNWATPYRNKIAGGFVNGWQVSGMLQLQSGANLTGNREQQLRHEPEQLQDSRARRYNVSNMALLGTPDIQFSPMLTCDPTANLGSTSTSTRAASPCRRRSARTGRPRCR